MSIPKTQIDTIYTALNNRIIVVAPSPPLFSLRTSKHSNNVRRATISETKSARTASHCIYHAPQPTVSGSGAGVPTTMDANSTASSGSGSNSSPCRANVNPMTGGWPSARSVRPLHSPSRLVANSPTRSAPWPRQAIGNESHADYVAL